MKILVLGNGFDLDHNLPTGYKDFLHFCFHITNFSGTGNKYYEKLTATQKKYVKSLDKKKKLKTKFISLLQNNNLFKYFYYRYDFLGDKWIDLEREIKTVVYEMESIEEEYVLSKKKWYFADGEHKIYDTLHLLGLDNVDNGNISEISLNVIHDALQESLRDFSKALELYIVNFINTTPINGVAPDIIDFDATDIITFNYSDTYQRVYSGVHWRENVNHIHGIACNNKLDGTNIVLGITTTSEKQTTNRYVDFEKYFQRVTKKTENTYKKWLLSKSRSKKHIQVVFFGHSLDSSDSDIIKDLICHDNTQVTIYYYNDKSYQTIVANLIEILNKDKFLEYTYGENPKIEFKLQRTHQHNNTAGVEIERDVRKLYKLYSIKSRDINKLIDKIFKKIKSKKLSYFYSQRRTIDLFEALKYVEVDSISKDAFFDICESLDFEVYKGGSPKKFSHEKWYGETPWGETIECSKETKELVDMVNESNLRRFQELKMKKPYAYFNKFSTAKEIKQELINIFKNEPTDIYWKNLNELMEEMVENGLFSQAVSLLAEEKQPISVSSKIKHFCLAYYETVYDYDMQKQWEEEQRNNQNPEQ